MKKFLVFLCSILLVFGVAGIAKAVPMYYTFEGSPYLVIQPAGTSFISDQGLAVGSSVNYIFEIDLDEVGTYDRYGMPSVTVAGTYYTDYLGGFTDDGGSALPDTEFYSAANHTSEYNYGRPMGTTWSIWANSQNNFLQITATGLGTPDLWDIGNTDFTAYNRMYNVNPDSTLPFTSALYAHLTLTDISDENPLAGGAPVPEPATMLLVGTGLIGLAGLGRKKLFKKP